jgi:hypothetical protein
MGKQLHIFEPTAFRAGQAAHDVVSEGDASLRDVPELLLHRLLQFQPNTDEQLLPGGRKKSNRTEPQRNETICA